ncbi:MAG: SAM-dependent methyltransferase [Desulfuromonas sp.]|nr:MAG: SAM-dependent methyltransferase [Desulfuromonas sp.]
MDAMEWNPGTLLQLSGNYWAGCALHAAVKLDLFSHQGSAEEIAEASGNDPRGTSMLLNALCALGLMEKEGGVYRSSAFAREFLISASPRFLGHIILHHHHLVAGWGRLAEAVHEGAPVRDAISHTGSEQERRSFELGMRNLASLSAPKVVPQIDLLDRRRLLDLGGGPGTYAAHFCQANPALQGCIVDLAANRPFAEETIADFDLAGRLDFVAADFITDPLPGGFDVAWLSHILHGEGEAGCRLLLEKAVTALEPGGLLLVQEFILDNDKRGPLFPALFSLNMLINTPNGAAYSEREIERLMLDAGLTAVRRLTLDLPNGAGIVAGIVPENR